MGHTNTVTACLSKGMFLVVLWFSCVVSVTRFDIHHLVILCEMN